MTNQETSQAKLTIAANIDRGIAAKGLTNRRVGDRIGKTEHQVWRWRRGKHQPDLDTLASLAEVLFDGDMTEFLRPAGRELSPVATSPQVATVAAEPPAATPPGAPDPAQRAPGTPTSQSRHEQRLDWTADSQTEVEEECA